MMPDRLKKSASLIVEMLGGSSVLETPTPVIADGLYTKSFEKIATPSNPEEKRACEVQSFLI